VSLLSCKTFFSVDWWVWCGSVTGFVCVSMEFHKLGLEKKCGGGCISFVLSIVCLGSSWGMLWVCVWVAGERLCLLVVPVCEDR
jgi:hypothetical protein